MPTLEQWADSITAVLDDLGSSEAVLVAFDGAFAQAALFAATHPSRTAALVSLRATWIRGSSQNVCAPCRSGDDPAQMRRQTGDHQHGGGEHAPVHTDHHAGYPAQLLPSGSSLLLCFSSHVTIVALCMTIEGLLFPSAAA
ncbi:hypothetical protein A5791_15360 [Mycobacterium sp. 852002-51163_SCH5372311]|nr:hypothetical protein A5791_15360 [Mycobacterium sp. 852002-51163_SCH5372311]